MSDKSNIPALAKLIDDISNGVEINWKVVEDAFANVGMATLYATCVKSVCDHNDLMSAFELKEKLVPDAWMNLSGPDKFEDPAEIYECLMVMHVDARGIRSSSSTPARAMLLTTIKAYSVKIMSEA